MHYYNTTYFALPVVLIDALAEISGFILSMLGLLLFAKLLLIAARKLKSVWESSRVGTAPAPVSTTATATQVESAPANPSLFVSPALQTAEVTQAALPSAVPTLAALSPSAASQKPLALGWLELAETCEKKVLEETLHNTDDGMLVTLSKRAREGSFKHTFFLPLDTKCYFSALSRSINTNYSTPPRDAESSQERPSKRNKLYYDADFDRSSPLPNEYFFSDPEESSTRISKLQTQFQKATGARLAVREEKGQLLLTASWKRSEVLLLEPPRPAKTAVNPNSQ